MVKNAPAVSENHEFLGSLGFCVKRKTDQTYLRFLINNSLRKDGHIN